MQPWAIIVTVLAFPFVIELGSLVRRLLAAHEARPRPDQRTRKTIRAG